MSTIEFLNHQSKAAVITLGMLLVALIGITDYVTGAEIAFSIFYLVPIILVSWYLGRTAGLCFCILSGIIWLVADLRAGHVYSHSAVPYWNALVRFGIFLIVSHVLTQRKRAEVSFQQSNEKLKDLANELTQLTETGDLLRACSSPKEACVVLARSTRRIFPDSSGALYLISSSRNLLEAAATWGPSPGELLCTPEECWALRRGRMHLIKDTETGILCSHRTSPCAASSLCIPLVASGETLGVFHLQEDSLTDSDVRISLSLSEQIALSLANLGLQETLRNQAIRDPLTGLFNRRYLEESLEREIKRATRADMPIGLIMIDLDHFKQFNDTFGHQGGDALLQAFGKFLQDSIRGGDIACRYGGEEFLLMLPESSVEQTEQRAEQVRNGTSQITVKYGEQRLIPVTCSVGIACFPVHGLTATSLLEAADRALYQAKREGRDRVARPRNLEVE